MAALPDILEDASNEIPPMMRHDPTKLRGVGPLVATAFVAEVGDPRAFRNGRQVCAWLGTSTAFQWW
jgi:transposase